MTGPTASEPAADEATTVAVQDTPTSSGEYDSVDPGYDDFNPADDDLESLIAENKKNPSDEESGDASETDSDPESEEGEAEETAETSAGDDDGADAQAAESIDDISDELLDRAIAVGYELDDIRDFKDAASFERELTRVERFMSRSQGKQSTDETVKETETPESKEPDWDQMIEDGHDPDIIALQKTTWQRATAAEAEVRRLQDAERVRAATVESDRFDDALNALGDEYAGIFGKGRRGELSGTETANRQKVYTTMAILKNGYAQAGQPIPPDSDLIQSAVHATFHKQAQEFARKEIKNKLKKSGSQALSRPQSGGTKVLSGAERAYQKEQEMWKRFE